ncbi:hypothetical protein BJV78DRAFT_1284069 [Lactifluus subvellereus]|nr:hypothetical protein BJV78DRAFT_1284069 [Lactifluus subvellereus]
MENVSYEDFPRDASLWGQWWDVDDRFAPTDECACLWPGGTWCDHFPIAAGREAPHSQQSVHRLVQRQVDGARQVGQTWLHRPPPLDLIPGGEDLERWGTPHTASSSTTSSQTLPATPLDLELAGSSGGSHFVSYLDTLVDSSQYLSIPYEPTSPSDRVLAEVQGPATLSKGSTRNCRIMPYISSPRLRLRDDRTPEVSQLPDRRFNPESTLAPAGTSITAGGRAGENFQAWTQVLGHEQKVDPVGGEVGLDTSFSTMGYLDVRAEPEKIRFCAPSPPMNTRSNGVFLRRAEVGESGNEAPDVAVNGMALRLPQLGLPQPSKAQPHLDACWNSRS